MEGTAEVNDTTANDSLRIERKGSDAPLQQPDGCSSSLKIPATIVSHDDDWHERASLLQSPRVALEAIAGRSRDLNCSVGTQPRSQSLCARLQFWKNPEVIAEKLTTKRYKSPIISSDGSSSSREKPSVRTSLWPNLTRLAGKPQDKAPISLGNKEAESSAHFPSVSSQRPLPCKQLNPDTSNMSDKHIGAVDKGIVLNNSFSDFSHDLRSVDLSASGFQMISSLKGNGVAYKLQGGHYTPDDAITSQTIGSNFNGRIATDSPNVSESIGFESCGRTLRSSIEGISLREWLMTECQKMSKIEKMHIFKQILVFVDVAHSRGLVLQHLQPSYFLLLAPDKVIYVGSFIPQELVELLPASIGQGIHHAYNFFKRKRHMVEDEKNKQKPKLNHETFAADVRNTYSYKVGFRGEDSSEENISKNSKEGSLMPQISFGRCPASGFNLDLQHSLSELLMLEEVWYARFPESNDGSSCLSTNMYNLGVLFFELFSSSETWEIHCTAMSNLQHQILPPSFLSKHPAEAGFCLWLLHPDSNCRPKSRDVILCDLISEGSTSSAMDNFSEFSEEEVAEAGLLYFLYSLKEQKEKQAAELVEGLKCLEKDLEEVKRKHSISSTFLNGEDLLTKFSEISELQSLENPIIDVGNVNHLRGNLMRKINQLENAYYSMRFRIGITEDNSSTRSDTDLLKMRDWHFEVQDTAIDTEWNKLGPFFQGLCKFARHSKLEMCGSLKNIEMLNSANVIYSLSFNGDEDYFAAAGVSKRIKIFDFCSLLDETVDIHYPLIELSSRSKPTCVCWNSYKKNYLASTDIEGVVQLWDASVGKGFTEFTAHQKRAWSVDFSKVDPNKLASGSDDCFVKLWSINERKCMDTIKNVANVCCVQFSPYSSHLLSFGSADYRIYCFDMRHTRIPWCTIVGHEKAVSYVKFLDAETLVSASTDSTLKIWDLKKTNASGLSSNSCSLTLSGHTNEKNFVGLSVCNGYITCGSETNEVFAYYRTFPMPMVSQKFGSIDPITAQETNDDGGQFISSVCWRGKSNMVLAANSTGSIKIVGTQSGHRGCLCLATTFNFQVCGVGISPFPTRSRVVRTQNYWPTRIAKDSEFF